MNCKFLNIYKIKNNFKKGITPLLCVLTVFNFICIPVSARDSDYYIEFPFPEPKVDEKSGYIVLQLFDSQNRSYEFLYYYVIDTEDPRTNTQILINNSTSSDGSSFQITTSTQDPISYPGYGYMLVYRNHDNTWERKGYVQMVNNPGSYSLYDDFGTRISGFYVKGPYDYLGSNVRNMSLQVRFNSESNPDEYIDSLKSSLHSINQSINNMNVNLGNIANLQNQNLIDIEDILGSILNQTSNGSIQDVSSSGITSVENKENALVGNNVSTNDLNVSINPNAASVVWGLIDDLTTSNAKVFGMFISILTIAVIGLILNR